MQASILQFPDSQDGMPNSEKRFQSLVERLDALALRVDGLTMGNVRASIPKTPWTAWIPLIASVVVLLVGIVTTAVTVTNHIDGEISAIRGDVSSLGTRTTKLEGAIKTLADQQSDQTQKLIHDLLATATTKPELPNEQKILAAATSLVTTLQSEKSPASPEFFQDGINALNRIDEVAYSPAVTTTRIAFARYRSVLEPMPSNLNPNPPQFRSPISGPPLPTDGIRSLVPAGVEIIAPGEAPLPQDRTFSRVHLSFTNLNIFAEHGGYQVLDGIHWHNIVFIGAHIIYYGGELDLQYVRFVNCTFEIRGRKQPSIRGKGFLDYAALQEKQLSYGLEESG